MANLNILLASCCEFCCRTVVWRKNWTIWKVGPLWTLISYMLYMIVTYYAFTCNYVMWTDTWAYALERVVCNNKAIEPRAINTFSTILTVWLSKINNLFTVFAVQLRLFPLPFKSTIQFVRNYLFRSGINVSIFRDRSLNGKFVMLREALRALIKSSYDITQCNSRVIDSWRVH